MFACVKDEENAALLGRPRPSITMLIMDVTQQQQIQAAAAAVGEAGGEEGLQALVNNAGCPGPLSPLELLEPAVMERLLQV